MAMQFSVNTAQNVKIGYELAGIGPRILAFLIDALIIGAVGTVFFIFCSMILVVRQREGLVLAIILITLLSFYHLLCEIFLNGRSVGKLALGLQVIRTDGKKVNFWNYLLRWVFRLIDISVTGGAAAIITIASTKRMQRLGDLAAGTTVIRQKQKATLSHLSQYATPEEYRIVFPQVGLLSDRDITTIKEVVSAIQLSGDMGLYVPLCRKIKEITGISTDMNNRDFVRTVLQDYTHLTRQ